ncbi:PspA/IM30 family protein [Thermodesulfobacteriota bacterium]
MGILTRIVRIFRADVHGVMDQLEDKELFLKQSLREMREEVERSEARMNEMEVSRHHMEGLVTRYEQEAEKVDQEITLAIQKGEESIARVLIKKRQHLEMHMDELGRRRAQLEQEMSRVGEDLREQKLQYENIRIRSETYLQNRRQETWLRSPGGHLSFCEVPSDAQVELELIRRREAMEGGAGQ